MTLSDIALLAAIIVVEGLAVTVTTLHLECHEKEPKLSPYIIHKLKSVIDVLALPALIIETMCVIDFPVRIVRLFHKGIGLSVLIFIAAWLVESYTNKFISTNLSKAVIKAVMSGYVGDVTEGRWEDPKP